MSTFEAVIVLMLMIMIMAIGGIKLKISEAIEAYQRYQCKPPQPPNKELITIADDLGKLRSLIGHHLDELSRRNNVIDGR